MKARLNLFMVAMAFFLSLQAQARFSKQQLDRNFRTCAQFLKLSPAEQASAIKGQAYSLNAYRWACRGIVKRGLRANENVQRDYDELLRSRWHHASNNPSSNSNQPRPSDSSVTGTCYNAPACSGTATHVSMHSDCPADTSSFHADYGFNGCEE